MALIGKIRDKSWLILVFVGVAMIAFIMGGWDSIFGGYSNSVNIGEIYGESVDYNKFNEEVKIAEENNRASAEQNGQEAQPVDVDAVWNSFVEKEILNKEYASLGLEVSDNEFDAYLYGTDGFSVQPELEQGFRDSTGVFNPKLLEQRIEQMKTSDDAKEQKLWESSKKYYVEKRQKEKYYELLGQGMYVTKLEAKNEYFAQKEIKNISFVLKRYSTIKDDEINLKEEKIKAYFEEHKTDRKYETRASQREVRFIDIAIEPSADDSAKHNKAMAEYKSGFATTKNDSLYVISKSEMPYYTSNAYSTAVPETHKKAQQHLTYPARMDTLFNNLSVGQIIGPYDHKGSSFVAKVIGFTNDTINARHILLPVEQGKESQAEARADSILKVINHGNFVEYVQKYSTDAGSKIKDGDLGDFFFSDMVAPFAMYCADKPIGEIGKVRSQFGIHIIEVLGRKGPLHPRLAIIQKTLTPSEETNLFTEDKVYDLLSKLDSKISKKADPYKKVELFDTLVNKEGHYPRNIQIQDNMPRFGDMFSSSAEDAFLRLAFGEDAKVGDLVSAPVRDENRYLIGILSSIRVKGEIVYENVKAQVKSDYIKDQKAKRLKAQMAKKSLKELVSKDNMLRIENAEIVFSNHQIPGAGMEPDIVGAIFSGLKDGSKTLPLEGNQGVYVIRIDKTTKAPAATNYKVEQEQLLSMMRGNIQGEVKKSLLKLADPVDNRRFNELGLKRK